MIQPYNPDETTETTKVELSKDGLEFLLIATMTSIQKGLETDREMLVAARVAGALEGAYERVS